FGGHPATPQVPKPTSGQGCPCAAGDRGWSRGPDGSRSWIASSLRAVGDDRPGTRAITGKQHNHLWVPMAEQATIFALSSGHGRAGVAVIRISGPAAGGVLDKMAGPPPRAPFAAFRPLQHPAG